MITARRTIRIKAFQALFQLTYNPRTSVEDAVMFAIQYPLEEREEALSNAEALQIVLPGDNITEQVASESLDYLTDLVTGVTENKKYLDEQIEALLNDWTIQRIDVVNLLILRIAAYELYFHEETDPRIVMNEAIEMTKSFNNEKASKFVNGVLQGILDTKEA